MNRYCMNVGYKGYEHSSRVHLAVYSHCQQEKVFLCSPFLVSSAVEVSCERPIPLVESVHQRLKYPASVRFRWSNPAVEVSCERPIPLVESAVEVSCERPIPLVESLHPRLKYTASVRFRWSNPAVENAPTFLWTGSLFFENQQQLSAYLLQHCPCHGSKGRLPH